MKRTKETASPFRDFLFKNPFNRRALWIIGVLVLLQIGVFKYMYPYASYIHGDSFSYLNAAYQNKTLNHYMIGYSMFLRVFSVFTTSDLALTVFQYLFIEFAALSLCFTLFYFYKPSKTLQIILLSFMTVNPLFLYLGNTVSSDPFFLALSLIWITLLLWIIERPSLRLIIWHTLILYITFTVRYNALIYLLIACVAFILSRQVSRMKFLGIGAGAISIGLFILFNAYQYKVLTGYWEYSPFAGWQLSNNAMYAYRYVDSAKRKPVPRRFQALDNNIRKFFDSTRDIKKFPSEAIMASTYYMWSPGLPLFNYRDSTTYRKDRTSSDLKKWASMGPLYKSYGLYIIKSYPLYYARYFLWPNAIKYYSPPLEFMEEFNSGKDSVAGIAKIWFAYPSLKITKRVQNLQNFLLGFYPVLSGTVNVIMFITLLFFLLLNGFKISGRLSYAIIFGASIWLFNAIFTIFASSAALRFQAFPFILSTVYAGLLVDWIAKMASMKTVPTYEIVHKKIVPA